MHVSDEKYAYVHFRRKHVRKHVRKWQSWLDGSTLMADSKNSGSITPVIRECVTQRYLLVRLPATV